LNTFQGSYGTFIAAAVNLPLKTNALMQGYIRFGGRKLLQVRLASVTGVLIIHTHRLCLELFLLYITISR